MNKYLKGAVQNILKIIFAFVALYLSLGIFFTKTKASLAFGVCFIVLVILPAVFIVFFKKKFLEKHPEFINAWKISRIIFILSFLIFASFIALGLYRLHQKNSSAKIVDFINSQKITLADVMGNNLPPQPNQLENDSTLAGIDANHNFIRDDVELMIFKKYPNSPKIRAAELQYAQALQLALVTPNSRESFAAALKKKDSSGLCLVDAWPDKNLNLINKEDKFIEDTVLDTFMRHKKDSENYDKYMYGYAMMAGQYCDVKI